MEDYNNIYPQVPQSGDNFRLQKSCEALASLEKEMKHYENVRKKYNRTRGIFTHLSAGAGVLSVVLSASGLGTSLTGLGAVIGIPLGAIGGLSGVISVGCGVASKRLSRKVSKHEQTVALAKAKANTIHDLVSKAMRDNIISDQEFSLILAEVDKFEALKLEIRQRFRTRDSEKKVDMAQLRTEIRTDIIKSLSFQAPAH